MKKIFSFVLIVLFCLTLTACSLFGEKIAPQKGNDTQEPQEPPHEHSYFDYWSYDDTCHWHQTSCEHSSVRKDVEEHSFEQRQTVSPTYSADGYTVYTCVTCGYEEHRDIVPQLVHYRGDSVLTAIDLGRERDVDEDGFLTAQLDTGLVGRTYYLKFTMTFYFRYFHVEFRNPDGGYYGVDDVDVKLHQAYNGSIINDVSLTTETMDGKTGWVLADRSEIDSLYDTFCLEIKPGNFANWTVVAVHNDKTYVEMTSDTADVGAIEGRETYYFTRTVALREEMLLVLTLRVHYYVYNESTGEVEDTILAPYKSTISNYNVAAEIVSGGIKTNMTENPYHDASYNVEGYRLTVYSTKEEEDPVYISLRFSVDKDVLTVDGTDYAPYLEVHVSYEVWE